MTDDLKVTFREIKERLGRELRPENFDLASGSLDIIAQNKGCTVRIPTGAAFDKGNVLPAYADAITLRLIKDKNNKTSHWSVNINVVYPSQEERTKQLRRSIARVLRDTGYPIKFENALGKAKVIL